ncbi:fimbrial protein [Enterobacter wuhouensis]|uniref:fimbrial protein n=1 Tax=Enterobacter wuhouensis TaxID=2529381 RepID=UPI002FCEB8D8
MNIRMLSVAISLLTAALPASAIEGESSTINFTGNITEATCALTTGGGPLSVVLGDVAANTLKQAGLYSTANDFTIGLEDCDVSVANQASVTFSGDTASDTALKTRAGAMAASGVGIQILQNGQPLILDGSTASAEVALTTGSNSLPFSARYIALDENVTAGRADATANFTMNYQ